MSTYIKTTEDGRKVEVIDQYVCLDGTREADTLVAVSEHPNQAAILQAVPDATHMAGRLALTAVEAVAVQKAFNAAKAAYETSPKGLAERMRRAQNGAIANRDG